MKKYAKGGFSAAQEEWLGGADRTDPYILARMRAAHPDEAPTTDDSPAGTSGYGEENEMPASTSTSTPVTKTVTQTKASVTKPKSQWEGVDEGARLRARKPFINIPERSNIGLRQFKSQYKSGGSVSSASKRADGCAIRGKTRA